MKTHGFVRIRNNGSGNLQDGLEDLFDLFFTSLFDNGPLSQMKRFYGQDDFEIEE